MNTITCTLPAGYIDQENRRYRQVHLQPFTGEVEALVADLPDGPALVSQILALSIAAIGPHPGSVDLARQLLVADRQFLLLQLRAATYGERVGAVLHCTQPRCGHKMDIDFSISDIPVTTVADVHTIYQAELSAEATAALGGNLGPKERTISFRLPNGEDQEALVPLLRTGRATEAATLLLQRCIQHLGSIAAPTVDLLTTLPDAVCAEIETAMATAAPRVELTMEGHCPECRQAFAVPFDLEAFVLQELRTSLDALTREVHYLAYHYHWSEREIMQMPRAKRHRYLHILSEEMEKVRYAA
jgi:hypothetical protein